MELAGAHDPQQVPALTPGNRVSAGQPVLHVTAGPGPLRGRIETDVPAGARSDGDVAVRKHLEAVDVVGARKGLRPVRGAPGPVDSYRQPPRRTGEEEHPLLVTACVASLTFTQLRAGARSESPGSDAGFQLHSRDRSSDRPRVLSSVCDSTRITDCERWSHSRRVPWVARERAGAAPRSGTSPATADARSSPRRVSPVFGPLTARDS